MEEYWKGDWVVEGGTKEGCWEYCEGRPGSTKTCGFLEPFLLFGTCASAWPQSDTVVTGVS